MILGAVVSCTVTVWVWVVALPQASVAVQLRVKTYSWSQLPAALVSAKFTVNAPSQASVAVKVGAVKSASQFMVVSLGVALSTGDAVSLIVNVAVVELVLVEPSEAVKVTEAV